ncbi:hypothetical protein BHM03_00061715 [Ensete ventricosum]|nr:hypothetical protein BHM03_00061715 [Ensete ventricosum]
MSVILSHPQNLPLRVFDSSIKSRLSKIQCLGYSGTELPPGGTPSAKHQQLISNHGRTRCSRLVIVRAVSDEAESNSSDDDEKDLESKKEEVFLSNEFMGRNLLAMNVMWKYMEQVNVIFVVLTYLSIAFRRL